MIGTNSDNIIELHGQVKTCKKELEKELKRLELFKPRVENIEKKLGKKKNELKQIQTEGITLKKQLSEKQSQITRISEEQQEIAVSSEEVASLESDYQGLLAGKDNLKTKVDGLERCCRNIIDQFNLPEIVNHLNQMNKIDTELQEKTKQEKDLENKKNNLEQVKRNTEKDMEEVNRAIQRTRTERGQEIDDYLSLDEKIQELTIKTGELNKKKNTLSERIVELTRKKKKEEWHRLMDQNKQTLAQKKKKLEETIDNREGYEKQKFGIQQQLEHEKELLAEIRDNQIKNLAQIKKNIEDMLEAQGIEYKWLIEGIEQYTVEKISLLLEEIKNYSLQTIFIQEKPIRVNNEKGDLK